MHCFYVEPEQINGNMVAIRGSDVNHLKNVLRKLPGDEITVCDGRGSFYRCRLEGLAKQEVTASIMEAYPAGAELKPKFYLFQGIPKKDKMELIIQKAVELGVYEIIPVATKFCVAKIEDANKERKKIERWQAISEAAAKQSGRGIIPKVHSVLSFPEALAYAEPLSQVLIPYELAEGIQNSVQKLETAVFREGIGIFIGPEGGFSKEEIKLAERSGAAAITLGKRILRTETAGFAVLSYLMLAAEAAEEKTRQD